MLIAKKTIPGRTPVKECVRQGDPYKPEGTGVQHESQKCPRLSEELGCNRKSNIPGCNALFASSSTSAFEIVSRQHHHSIHLVAASPLPPAMKESLNHPTTR